jgi:hypothetical protein
MNVDNRTCMITHIYEHTHSHPSSINTSEKLNRLNLYLASEFLFTPKITLRFSLVKSIF